jgi:hypothetical protein
VRRHTGSTVGFLARLALFACTLVGLAAMHSLGHAGGPHASALSGHHPVLGMAASGTFTATPEDCHDGACAHVDAPTHNPGGGMSDWSICLAVLAATAAGVLLTALLLQRSTWAGATGTPGNSPPGASRAPPDPRPPPVGLIVAEASVLRR